MGKKQTHARRRRPSKAHASGDRTRPPDEGTDITLQPIEALPEADALQEALTCPMCGDVFLAGMAPRISFARDGRPLCNACLEECAPAAAAAARAVLERFGAEDEAREPGGFGGPGRGSRAGADLPRIQWNCFAEDEPPGQDPSAGRWFQFRATHQDCPELGFVRLYVREGVSQQMASRALLHMQGFLNKLPWG